MQKQGSERAAVPPQWAHALRKQSLAREYAKCKNGFRLFQPFGPDFRNALLDVAPQAVLR
jgi:hypothetical protein